MDKRKLFLPLLFVAAMFLSSCANENSGSAPPELIEPVSAQLRLDTVLVTRGLVADVERYSGIVRIASEPVGIGAVTGTFYGYFVLHGDFVTEGQIIARLDTTHTQEQIDNQVARIANIRRDHYIENSLRSIAIELMEIEHAALRTEIADLQTHIAAVSVTAPAPPATADDNYEIDDTDENNSNVPLESPPDTSAYEERLAQMQTNAARLNANITDARTELNHLQVRQAHSLVNEEAILQNLRTVIAQSEIRAPFDGTVVDLTSWPGRFLASFTHVAYIAPVDATVFVEYIGLVPFTTLGAVQIDAHVEGSVYSATRLPITREQAWRYTRPPLRFLLDTDTPPPVGAYVTLRVYRARVEDALRIPRNALYEHEDIGFYVFRIVDGQREQTMVAIGAQTETYVEVTWGLEEGDEVYVRAQAQFDMRFHS